MRHNSPTPRRVAQKGSTGAHAQAPHPRQWHDRISGGLADRYTPDDFNPAALQQGIEVELEHTYDRTIAKEIAMDHLVEDPAYYRKLAIMESS